MQPSNFVNVPEEIAKRNPGECGLSTWWAMEGHLEITEDLTKAWVGAGLGHLSLPPLPTPEEALSRVLAGYRARGRRLVHNLPNGKWTITEMSLDDQENPTYKSECQVSLNKVGHVVIKPADHPLGEGIIRDVQEAMLLVGTEQLTPWLTGYLRSHNGIRLRRQGGVYYLPPGYVAEWEKITKVLEETATGKGRVIIEGWPAVAKENALRAILNAVRSETQELMEEIEKNKGSLGEKGLENQIAKCEGHKKMLDAYKELLGVSIDGLYTSVDDMEVELGEAKIRLIKAKENAKDLARSARQ